MRLLPLFGFRSASWTSPALLASTCLALASPIVAQSVQEDADGQVDLALEEEILVTATRSAEALGTSSASATIFGKDELTNAPGLVVDELLRSAPGFSLFRRSSSAVAQPTTQGVSLRGIGPSGVSRTLVLLDGVPLNDPFGGWVAWSRVPLPSLERVEIVRGGGSNVWGSSALGGVIQLFSARPDGLATRLLLEAGERSTSHGDFAVSNRSETWEASAHANVFDYGGYRQIREDQRGAIDIPAGSEHWQIDGRLGWSPTNGTDLSVRAERFDEQRSNGTPLTDNASLMDQIVVSAEIETGSAGGWSLRAHWQDQEFAARFSAQASDRETERPALDQFLVGSERTGLSAVWRKRVGVENATSHSLVAGVDSRMTEGATNERFFFTGGDFIRERTAGGEEELFGIFVQDTVSFGDRVELQLGIRFDEWKGSNGLRRERNRSDGSIRLEQFADDRTEDAISPRAGLSVALGESLRLKAAAYGAFRAPTINELYRPFRVGSDITAANAELVPEELVGAELGLAGVSGPWRWSTTLFHNQIDDPVANVTIGFGPGFVVPCGFTPGSGSCRQRQNLDRTVVQGAEAEARARVGKATIDFAYQYSDAEVDSAPNAPALEGRRLAQVPEHSAAIRADVTLAPRWSVEVGVRYAGQQFEDDLNLRPLDSFTLFHAGARFVITDGATVFLRVENLFDEDVEVSRSGSDLYTIGAPRTVRGGVRFAF